MKLIEDQFSHILTLEQYEKERTIKEYFTWIDEVTLKFSEDCELKSLFHSRSHKLIKRFKDEAIPLGLWLRKSNYKNANFSITLLSGDQKMDAIFTDNNEVVEKIEITNVIDLFDKNKCDSVQKKISAIRKALYKKCHNKYEEKIILVICFGFQNDVSDCLLKRELLENFQKENIYPFKEVYLIGRFINFGLVISLDGITCKL